MSVFRENDSQRELDLQIACMQARNLMGHIQGSFVSVHLEVRLAQIEDRVKICGV